MIFYALPGIVAVLGGLYIAAHFGWTDRLQPDRRGWLRGACDAAIVMLGLACSYNGAPTIFLFCLLFGVPLTHYLLSPSRGRWSPAAAKPPATRDEALRLLELEPEEDTPGQVQAAYERLLALVPEKNREASFYAARLGAAYSFLRGASQTDALS